MEVKQCPNGYILGTLLTIFMGVENDVNLVKLTACCIVDVDHTVDVPWRWCCHARMHTHARAHSYREHKRAIKSVRLSNFLDCANNVTRVRLIT